MVISSIPKHSKAPVEFGSHFPAEIKSSRKAPVYGSNHQLRSKVSSQSPIGIYSGKILEGDAMKDRSGSTQLPTSDEAKDDLRRSVFNNFSLNPGHTK